MHFLGEWTLCISRPPQHACVHRLHSHRIRVLTQIHKSSRMESYLAIIAAYILPPPSTLKPISTASPLSNNHQPKHKTTDTNTQPHRNTANPPQKQTLQHGPRPNRQPLHSDLLDSIITLPPHQSSCASRSPTLSPSYAPLLRSITHPLPTCSILHTTLPPPLLTPHSILPPPALNLLLTHTQPPHPLRPRDIRRTATSPSLSPYSISTLPHLLRRFTYPLPPQLTIPAVQITNPTQHSTKIDTLQSSRTSTVTTHHAAPPTRSRDRPPSSP